MRGKKAKSIRRFVQANTIGLADRVYTMEQHTPTARKALCDITKTDVFGNQVVRSPHSNHVQIRLTEDCTRYLYQKVKRGYKEAKHGLA